MEFSRVKRIITFYIKSWIGMTIKKNLALLIPAHNEEPVIKTSISSAINAGLNAEDIYIVDDNSSDNTLIEAYQYLPKTNILRVQHSGKAGAVYAGIKYFQIENRYNWVHVADADSFFSKDYFRIYFAELDNRCVATVGFVQSLIGNWICSYRAITYTYGQHIIKRVQAIIGMITVFPGPVTSYRTDIIKDLDFFTGSVTEDFDLTLQIYRKKLGRIKYIPDAVNYTQDPKNLRDFYNQTWRWYRGFFQGVRRYDLGWHFQRIDLSVLIQFGDILLFLFQLTITAWILLFSRENISFLVNFLILDFAILSFVIIYSTIITKRARLLMAIFYFHFLKFFELVIYLKAFHHVIIKNRFISAQKGWEVTGRRYKLTKKAMADFS